MGDRSRRGAAAAARAALGLLIVATAVLGSAGTAHAATTASLTPGQASPGITRSLSWTVGDSAPGNPLLCQVTDPSGAPLAGTPLSPCVAGDVLNVTLSPSDPNGSYTASVTDTVLAETVTSTYTLDTEAADPVFSTTPTTPTNATTLTWTWTSSEPGDECMLAAPAPDAFTWSACAGGTLMVTPTAASGGSYTLSVRGVDGLGNTSPGISDTVVRDVTAIAPSFSAVPTTPTNANSLTWTWTSSEPTDECSLDSPVLAEDLAWAACSGGTLSSPATGEGAYAFSVRSVDGLGNTSSVVTSTVVRDVTGPTPTGLTVNPSTVGRSSNPVATFSGLASGDVATCRVDAGAATVVDPVGCTSPWTVPAGSLSEGNYLVVVTAVDGANNRGGAASAGFSVDLTGPTAAPVVTSTPGVTGNDDTPTWTFTVGAGESAECQFEQQGRATPLTSWMACGSPVTTQSLLGRPEVTYTLRIRALDSLGNVGAETSSTYLYDVTAPAAPTVVLSATAGQSPSVSASWAGSEAATCTVSNSSGGVVSGPTPCTSGVTLGLPAVEDVYTVAVRLIDLADNASGPGSATYRYDITPPSAPGVSGPSQGNTPTPTFNLTATEAGEVLTCTWTLPAASPTSSATVLGPSTCSGSSYQPSPPLSGDGPWTLSVVGTDLAGNTSPATLRGYNLDTGPPPAPSIVLAPGSTNPGNDLTPTWNFTAELSATTECELRIGSAVLSAWGLCPGGTVTYNLTPVDPTVLPDGVYTLWVRATDPFGNTGPAGSSAYTLDTLPPGVPSWISQPTGPAATAATWRFSTGGDNAECQLEHGGVTVGSWAPCSSPWTPALGSDGDYALTVRAVDPAGNRGDPVTSIAYILDTTGPGVPLLTQSPATPAPDTAPAVGFSIDATATASDCRVTLGGAAVVDWSPCASPWVADLGGEPDGVYDLEIRAVDEAGNVSPTLSFGYDLDSSAPVAVGLITGPTGPARGRTPAFEFPAAPGTTAQCQVTGPSGTLLTWTACAPPCPPTAASSCVVSYALNLSGLPDGEYRLVVRLVDMAGNPSADKFTTYLLDTTAPPAPVFGLLPPSPTAEAVTDWRWSGEAGAAASCQVTSGSRTVLGWRACTSPYRVNLAGQPDGSYTFWVRVTDLAGNTSRPRTAAIIRDTTAPTVQLLTTPSAVTTDRTPTWTWTTEAGATASCLLTRGAVVVVDWRPCSGTFTGSLTSQPDGTYRLSVRPVDRAGNMGKVTSSAVTVTRPSTSVPPSGGARPPVAPPPIVTPPTSGPAEGVPPVAKPGEQPPTSAPTAQPTSRRPVPSGGSLVPPAPVSRVPDLLGRAAVRSLDRPQIPVLIVVLIVAFLLIQNRIDRRDPKLAQAPLGAEPTLGFGPLGAGR